MTFNVEPVLIKLTSFIIFALNISISTNEAYMMLYLPPIVRLHHLVVVLNGMDRKVEEFEMFQSVLPCNVLLLLYFNIQHSTPAVSTKFTARLANLFLINSTHTHTHTLWFTLIYFYSLAKKVLVT